jgi:hypothetical protein
LPNGGKADKGARFVSRGLKASARGPASSGA